MNANLILVIPLLGYMFVYLYLLHYCQLFILNVSYVICLVISITLLGIPMNTHYIYSVFYF